MEMPEEVYKLEDMLTQWTQREACWNHTPAASSRQRDSPWKNDTVGRQDRKGHLSRTLKGLECHMKARCLEGV